jgi:hypothetical protein
MATKLENKVIYMTSNVHGCWAYIVSDSDGQIHGWTKQAHAQQATILHVETVSVNALTTHAADGRLHIACGSQPGAV